jgi:hypothetical protein
MTERSLDYARKEGIAWASQTPTATKADIQARVGKYGEAWGDAAASCFLLGVEQQFEVVGRSGPADRLNWLAPTN